MGRDTVLGLIVLAFAVAYVRTANSIPTSFLSDAVGAGGVPAILGWIMGGAGLVLVLQSLLKHRMAVPDEPRAMADGIFADPLRASRKAGGVVLIALSFLLLLPILGYIPAVALLLTAMLAYQGAAIGPRLLIVPLLGALALWMLFDLALGIDLPAGSVLQIF